MRKNLNKQSSTHPYTVVLTHDIDHLAMRNVPFFSRSAGSHYKRCIVSNLSRFLREDIDGWTYTRSFFSALSFPLVKLGILADPLAKALLRILKIEEEYGVRSTFYFMPFPNTPGLVKPGEPAEAHRGARYDVKDYGSLLQGMDKNGWEIGIHGINAHISKEDAEKELNVFRAILPNQKKWGMRMHWLYTSDILYKNLKEAGFYYDATFGCNDETGFVEDRYHPFEREGIKVLPLNIQDGSLLAHWREDLAMEPAWKVVKGVIEEAKEHQAVVTVLWHNASFIAPRYWEPLYRRIIEQGKRDNALFLTAAQAVDHNQQNG